MKTLSIAICAVWLAGAAALAVASERTPSNYHDDYRIIGTLERVTAQDIAVKQTKDGKVIAMAWQKESKVTRDKKPVPRAQLTPGLHVVVNARGDSLLELDVVEVRIVPPPAKK